MDIRTQQGRRSATLSICGDITDEGAVLAAAELGRLAGEAFYREVVVEITSDGGSVAAMRHLADAFIRLAHRRRPRGHAGADPGWRARRPRWPRSGRSGRRRRTPRWSTTGRASRAAGCPK